MDLQGILTIVLGMAGFGALVSALVNLGKSAGVVTDGTSQTWVTALNLVGVVALFVAQTMGLKLDMVAVDANFGLFATILVAAGQLVAAMGGSKLFYSVAKGAPVIGKSLSE